MNEEKDAPVGWAEALARSEAQLAAGQRVPMEPLVARIDESMARLNKSRASQRLHEGVPRS